MKEIRFHGRGGQGAVTAADLLASAMLREGKQVQAFPHFGVERRGAPVLAFLRFSDEPIQIRTYVYRPGYVVILDSSLIKIVDVIRGLKKNGVTIINTTKEPDQVLMNWKKVCTVDATSIALECIGAPIVNTAMLGAFSAATSQVRLESVIEAVKERFKGMVADRNAQAVKLGFERVKLADCLS